MPPVAQHPPGAFSWIELGTLDQNAAKHFYSSLFGWTCEDSPVGPNEFYTTFNLEGRNAAAAYTLRPEEIALQAAPHWNLYIAVASADAAAARGAELGATVLAGPFDVSGHGRAAVLADPTGAVFSLWEARNHPGLGVLNQPGALCWADLSTPDPDKAAAFYTGLFGYALPGENGYRHIQNGETLIGGIQPAAHRIPNAPPHWQIYIQVEDCAAITDKAKTLGAAIYVHPTEIGTTGIMSVIADPQGAMFALFQLTTNQP